MAVSMARNDSEKEGFSLLSGADEQEPRYPPGLMLMLDEPEVQKLGLEDPQVGSTIPIEGTVQIVAVESDERGRHLRLQVTSLGVESNEGEEKERETILYG
jgi:hypothetical protein